MGLKSLEGRIENLGPDVSIFISGSSLLTPVRDVRLTLLLVELLPAFLRFELGSSFFSTVANILFCLFFEKKQYKDSNLHYKLEIIVKFEPDS